MLTIHTCTTPHTPYYVKTLLSIRISSTPFTRFILHPPWNQQPAHLMPLSSLRAHFNLGVTNVKLYQASGSYLRAIEWFIVHTFPLNKTSRWYRSNQPMPSITVVSGSWYLLIFGMLRLSIAVKAWRSTCPVDELPIQVSFIPIYTLPPYSQWDRDILISRINHANVSPS